MPDLHRSRPLLGVTLKIVATICLVVTGALVKLASADYPVGEIIFLRGVFGFVPLLIWVAAIGQLGTFYRTSRYGAHAGRSAIGIASMVCQFTAYGLLPLSDATALIHSSPIFLVAMAALFLGEKVRLVRSSAVVAGLLGVLLIVYNYVGFHSEATSQGSLLGIACAVSAAVLIAAAGVTVRSLTGFEPVATIVFYFTLLTVLASLLTLPFGWVMPGFFDFIILACVGLSAGCSQVLMTMSFRYADASTLAPFNYLVLVWALIAGWLIFDQLPDMLVVIGAAIVVGAGLVIIYRERKVRQDAKAPDA